MRNPRVHPAAPPLPHTAHVIIFLCRHNLCPPPQPPLQIYVHVLCKHVFGRRFPLAAPPQQNISLVPKLLQLAGAEGEATTTTGRVLRRASPQRPTEPPASPAPSVRPTDRRVLNAKLASAHIAHRPCRIVPTLSEKRGSATGWMGCVPEMM